jgi:hypothetical protein
MASMPKRPLPLCSVCIRTYFELHEIVASAKDGCPRCKIVLHGLLLVRNVQDVTQIFLDMEKAVYITCSHLNGEFSWYELYVSETGKVVCIKTMVSHTEIGLEFFLSKPKMTRLSRGLDMPQSGSILLILLTLLRVT